MSKKVGDRIRKYRQLAALSQEYVAEEIGMSGGNFGKIERGEIDINTELLYRLAKLFKISVTDFFEEKPIQAFAEKPVPYGYATKADLENLTELVKKLSTEIEKLRESVMPAKTGRRTSTKGKK